MRKAFLTLKKEAADEFTQKKSRFIGYGAPVESEEEALAFLENLRQKEKLATHIAYAYHISNEVQVQRFSDAGEPAGTAGRPIVEAMHNKQLDNAIVAVVRYYGGTPLGAGNLTRAYARAANMAIDACGLIKLLPAQTYSITFPYTALGKIEAWFAAKSYEICNRSFDDKTTFICIFPEFDLENILEEISEMTCGEASMLHLASASYIHQILEV